MMSAKLPAASTSCGATTLSGATTSCGATTLSGATTSCGATTSSGATTSCGATTSSGATPAIARARAAEREAGNGEDAIPAGPGSRPDTRNNGRRRHRGDYQRLEKRAADADRFAGDAG